MTNINAVNFSQNLSDYLAQITLSNLVDAAGIAGFALSLFLAIINVWTNRLQIKMSECVLVESDPKRFPNSIFLYVCLVNKTNLPFSLVSVHIDAGKNHSHIPIESTVRTFQAPLTDDKAGVEPVVLSQAFPARFDSYAAEVFLLEVLRQNIDVQSLHPDDPTHNQTGHLHRRFLQIHKLCRHRHLPWLVLNTSRGRRAIPIDVASVQQWEWLRQYAVQKAGHEEKLIFP